MCPGGPWCRMTTASMCDHGGLLWGPTWQSSAQPLTAGWQRGWVLPTVLTSSQVTCLHVQSVQPGTSCAQPPRWAHVSSLCLEELPCQVAGVGVGGALGACFPAKAEACVIAGLDASVLFAHLRLTRFTRTWDRIPLCECNSNSQSFLSLNWFLRSTVFPREKRSEVICRPWGAGPGAGGEAGRFAGIWKTALCGRSPSVKPAFI